MAGTGSVPGGGRAGSGMALGQHQQHQQGHKPGQQPQEAVRIREVWADNLEDEMSRIRALIDDYPFVAMVCMTMCSLEGSSVKR